MMIQKRNFPSKLLKKDCSDKDLKKNSLLIIYVKFCWIWNLFVYSIIYILNIIYFGITLPYTMISTFVFKFHPNFGAKSFDPNICLINFIKTRGLSSNCSKEALTPKTIDSNIVKEDGDTLLDYSFLCPIDLNLPLHIKRKILILDLDETLIHSYHENNILWRNNQGGLKIINDTPSMIHCIHQYYDKSLHSNTGKDVIFSQLSSISSFIKFFKSEIIKEGASYLSLPSSNQSISLKCDAGTNHKSHDLYQIKHNIDFEKPISSLSFVSESEHQAITTFHVTPNLAHTADNPKSNFYVKLPNTSFSKANGYMKNISNQTYESNFQYPFVKILVAIIGILFPTTNYLHSTLMPFTMFLTISFYRVYLMISFFCFIFPKLFIKLCYKYYNLNINNNSAFVNRTKNKYNSNINTQISNGGCVPLSYKGPSNNWIWDNIFTKLGWYKSCNYPSSMAPCVAPSNRQIYNNLPFGLRINNGSCTTNTMPSTIFKEPDFTLKLCIDRHPVRFFVYKRPHVDTFLKLVSQWYDLVIYTASMEVYGAGVTDHLERILEKRFGPMNTNSTQNSIKLGGCTPTFGHTAFSTPQPSSLQAVQDQRINNSNKNDSITTDDYRNQLITQPSSADNIYPSIFPRRYYRQHCKVEPTTGGFSKDLTLVETDLSRVFILDNSPAAYKTRFPNNGIHVASWFSDPHDRSLLDLLPFLDALRTVTDVRNVLSRNVHAYCTGTEIQPKPSSSYGGTPHAFTSSLPLSPPPNDAIGNSMLQREIALYGGGTTSLYNKPSPTTTTTPTSSYETFTPPALLVDYSKSRRTSQRLQFLGQTPVIFKLPPTPSPATMTVFTNHGSKTANYNFQPLSSNFNQNHQPEQNIESRDLKSSRHLKTKKVTTPKPS